MKKIFFLLFVYSSVASGQRADFFREDVTFRLDGRFLKVEGCYWFANPAGKPVNSNIFYPFPIASGAEVDSIRLFDLFAGRSSVFRNEGGRGISFDLFVAPHDTALFQIGYRQKLNGDSAVYILKTTQGWGKPLELAEFKLIIPNSLVIENMAYPYHKLYQIGEEKIYYWRMEKFMPEKDMGFHFSNSKSSTHDREYRP